MSTSRSTSLARARLILRRSIILTATERPVSSCSISHTSPNAPRPAHRTGRSPAGACAYPGVAKGADTAQGGAAAGAAQSDRQSAVEEKVLVFFRRVKRRFTKSNRPAYVKFIRLMCSLKDRDPENLKKAIDGIESLFERHGHVWGEQTRTKDPVGPRWRKWPDVEAADEKYQREQELAKQEKPTEYDAKIGERLR